MFGIGGRLVSMEDRNEKPRMGIKRIVNRMEDRYRWKIGIDGRSVSMEDWYRWKIGIDGISNENPRYG
jgi:hypothetical protein